MRSENRNGCVAACRSECVRVHVLLGEYGRNRARARAGGARVPPGPGQLHEGCDAQPLRVPLRRIGHSHRRHGRTGDRYPLRLDDRGNVESVPSHDEQTGEWPEERFVFRLLQVTLQLANASTTRRAQPRRMQMIEGLVKKPNSYWSHFSCCQLISFILLALTLIVITNLAYLCIRMYVYLVYGLSPIEWILRNSNTINLSQFCS